jgi:hypothetical protein
LDRTSWRANQTLDLLLDRFFFLLVSFGDTKVGFINYGVPRCMIFAVLVITLDLVLKTHYIPIQKDKTVAGFSLKLTLLKYALLEWSSCVVSTKAEYQEFH